MPDLIPSRLKLGARSPDTRALRSSLMSILVASILARHSQSVGLQAPQAPAATLG